MVTYHARLVEVTSRLDFLWKQQAERELADMMETRANNTQLLKNILPDHVAQHFLGEDRPAEVGTGSTAGNGLCLSQNDLVVSFPCMMWEHPYTEFLLTQ